MKTKSIVCAILLVNLLAACEQDNQSATIETTDPAPADTTVSTLDRPENPSRLDIYADVVLNPALGQLSDNQKQMIGLLIEAGKITDDIFWLQVWGDKDKFLNEIADPKIKRFATYNYGPWDRLAADQSFIESHGPRPPGARFYPQDMSKTEFESWQQDGKDGLYALVQRDANGALMLLPYSKAFESQINEIADLLVQASALAEDEEFANYLKMRAVALKTDDYQASDMAWMSMKNCFCLLIMNFLPFLPPNWS